ncbi:MAG TPA: hypothetical protein VD970_18295 [Acetobacteraceae bacterium]|nr:hypothetical protein [Acetobacteraceae bacterium]
MSGGLDPDLFGGGGLAVRIMDLSGANGAEPVEVVTGFAGVEHANAFARRYVRDSIERCRATGMDAAAVLAAWFAYGEDAEVEGAGEHAWSSRNEIKDFSERRPEDEEECNWRVLDPRRHDEDEDDED